MKLNRMTWMYAAILLIIGTWNVAFSQSVPQAGGAPANAPQANGAEAGMVDPASSPAVQEFLRSYAVLKSKSAEIQKLNDEYAQASPERKKAIEQSGPALMQGVMQLYMAMVPLAEKAFPESGGQVDELNLFLLDYVLLTLESDNYEDAYRLIATLLKSGIQKQHPELLEMAGTAAFMENQFPVAEQCFETAKKAGKLNQRGAMYLSMIPYYKEAWAKEQKIREAQKEANLPYVLIKTTAGDIIVELFEEEAPNTVANFISLVEKGFYNGLTFHRVLPGFMAQGGDPNGNGTGGPGYCIPCECQKPDARKHFRGTLSMAHAGKDTGGSQFFITFVPTKSLDGVHTAFGRVVKWFDVLAKIQRIDPEQPVPGVVPTKIVEMKVLQKREHPYVPTTLKEK